MKNQKAILVEPKKLEILEEEMPCIKDDEVLIQIKQIGICGSDVNFFNDATSGGIRSVTYPIILGHECGGVIVEKGKNVTDKNIGDLVAVEPGVPCRRCNACLSGHYNLCNQLTFLAAPPFRTGCLRRFMAYPADFTFQMAPNMDALDAALMEPMAIGLYAAKRAAVDLNDTIVILGGGAIGLLTLMACKARGAARIAVADLYDERLVFAKRFGADLVINSAKEDIEEAIRTYTGGTGADVVFESAGNAVTTALTTKIVRRGGKIAVVGMSHKPVPFDFYGLSYKECDILSIFRYVNMYPYTRDIMARGAVNPKEIVTGTFDFEDVQKAFETATNEKQSQLKIAIKL